MPSYRKPTGKELAKSREPRVANRHKAQQEDYVNILQRAKSLLLDGDTYTAGAIEQLIKAGTQELNRLNQLCGGRIVHRKMPKNKQSGEQCCVFLDECGAHELRSSDPYRVFVLSAVIISDKDDRAIDMAWKDFKVRFLGDPNTVVHEPDVRNRLGPFDEPDRQQKLDEMRRTFAALPFAIVTVIVHRDDYLHDFGLGPIDSSLPSHIYWMALDFLMERVAMALDGQFKGATARFVAEARGPLEDTQLQYEYARVLIQGTSYMRPGWFRQVLPPGVAFEPKGTNSTGLQLADLVARPVGDKVLDQQANPYLWDELRVKMCPGVETQNSILGFKVMPWREHYSDLWK